MKKVRLLVSNYWIYWSLPMREWLMVFSSFRDASHINCRIFNREIAITKIFCRNDFRDIQFDIHYGQRSSNTEFLVPLFKIRWDFENWLHKITLDLKRRKKKIIPWILRNLMHLQSFRHRNKSVRCTFNLLLLIIILWRTYLSNFRKKTDSPNRKE